MKFWLDAQLPPGLAIWLTENHHVAAVSLRDIHLRDASDTEIFHAARREQAVIVSKDSDFVELISRFGPPPKLLWVTCGNVSNRALRDVFSRSFSQAVTLLSSGESIVEIG